LCEQILRISAGYLPETFLATHKTRKMSSKQTRIPILNSADGFEERKRIKMSTEKNNFGISNLKINLLIWLSQFSNANFI
jgi:hypothetical protein